MSQASKRVVLLSGGVGGARLADGLQAVLEPGALTVVVNTGDDFEHWGLHISPDVDTILYTLSGLAHVERGWGLAEESFGALELMRRYGAEDWFALGDRDLATHLTRSAALRQGRTLTEVTAQMARALGVRTRILPMADGPCRTMLDTDEGTLAFQTWFVRRRAQPRVHRVWFDGAPEPAPGLCAALDAAELVVLGPSNPYVSIDPILSLSGVRDALARKRVVALSPIVGGRAVKGPLAEMIPSLASEPPSAAAIAHHYGPLLSGLVLEHGDEPTLPSLPVLATRTIMRDRPDRARLAAELLAWGHALPR